MNTSIFNIKNYLEKCRIKFKVFTHPPVYTCEEAKKYTSNIRGVHSKNLFLKNKKSKKFYLVIIPENKKVNMDDLGKVVNDKLKFASEDDLRAMLGLSSGAVSPFGLINDNEHKVEVLIDKIVWESEYVSFHPNINTETLEITKDDFHKYVKSTGNKYVII